MMLLQIPLYEGDLLYSFFKCPKFYLEIQPLYDWGIRKSNFSCNPQHLTWLFFLSHTKSFYVKWSYPIFCGPCGITMYPHPTHKMIDTPDPPSLPQGVP